MLPWCALLRSSLILFGEIRFISINQYKIIAERRAKEIQELETKYNIKPS